MAYMKTAICTEHVAWNGVSAVSNEFEMVQQVVSGSGTIWSIISAYTSADCAKRVSGRTSHIQKQDREV
jgi:hypothetical protein